MPRRLYHHFVVRRSWLADQSAKITDPTGRFGTLSVVRAFAPMISVNGGGSMPNILSVLSDLSEILADKRSREVRAALSGGAAALYPT